jgi:phosphatidylethanolamine-binding protein (PEBP) family uncharacterized protein
MLKDRSLHNLLELKPGKTKAEILQAIEGHVLSIDKLIGLYRR